MKVENRLALLKFQPQITVMDTIQIIIKGKVQGVWFRKSTKEKADELGVSGTVQNLPSGQVKVVAQGDKDALAVLIEWLKIGPKYAEVQSISKEPVDEPPQFQKFEIIR